MNKSFFFHYLVLLLFKFRNTKKQIYGVVANAPILWDKYLILYRA